MAAPSNAEPAAALAELTQALSATGPHPSLGDQAQALGRFVGTWQVEYMDVLKSGKELHRTGRFIVGWVMDGRAIQDVWIVDPSPGHAEREIYTDIRYFDPKTRTWPSVFFDPEHASMAKFVGAATAKGGVEFETSDLGYPQTRWSFEDFESNRFVFRDQSSSDDGKTWKLHAEYHMKRLGAVTAP